MKRNEIAIFEEFRLTPEKTLVNSGKININKKNLKKIILFKDNRQNEFFWKKEKNGSFCPVDRFGCPNFIKANQPNPKELTKFDTKFLAYFNKYDWPVEWWIEDSERELIKIYSQKEKKLIKEEKNSLSFKINAWVRDEAIKLVGLEIRKLKKRHTSIQNKSWKN